MQNPQTRSRLVQFVVFSALFLIIAPLTLSAAGTAENPATVTVIGQGELFAEPDQAAITLGVQLYDESAQAASAELRERMDSVIAAIRTLGIPDQQIQTMNYSIFFERDYQGSPTARTTDGRPAGVYRVENTVRVVITDVDSAARVVEAAIEAGANQMYGINFSFSDPGARAEEARTAAMDDARMRAEALAEAADRTVGAALEITEITDNTAPYESRAAVTGMGGGPVQPGSAAYTTRIQVTYELK